MSNNATLLGGACPTCSDGLRNGGEEGVDCGGPCRGCEIYCSTNESCGIPRWGPGYCVKNPDGVYQVIQDHISWECRNPGTKNSFCKAKKIWRVQDHCGPLAECYDGKCYDEDMDLPNPETPESGQNSGFLDDGRVYTTCRGANCFEVKLV